MCNDAATGLRTIFVDGFPVGSQAATTSSTPAYSAITVGDGMPGTLAEFLVWDGVVLDTVDLGRLTQAQRTKWEVISTTTAVASNVPSAAFGSARSLPSELPPPRCWLDAADATSVFADTAGTVYAQPNGRVGLWRDRSGNARHCTFDSAAAAAEWRASSPDMVAYGPAYLPVVRAGGGGPGLFPAGNGPLEDSASATVGFTVVAVWKMLPDARGGGGHPLAVGGVSRFSAGLWNEGLGISEATAVTPTPDQMGSLRFLGGG